MHPRDVTEPPPIEIGPHPHIGLATATWLVRGTVLHSDSLGTEQLIRPGELNLMTAGRGIATPSSGSKHRKTSARTASSARRCGWPSRWSRRFEHGVVPVDQPVKDEDAIFEPGSLALVPADLEGLRIEARAGSARFLLLGGEPFGVEIKIWWNFVARTFDEITEAWRARRPRSRFPPRGPPRRTRRPDD
jgi:quercetin 2,3-dioxygenase